MPSGTIFGRAFMTPCVALSSGAAAAAAAAAAADGAGSASGCSAQFKGTLLGVLFGNAAAVTPAAARAEADCPAVLSPRLCTGGAAPHDQQARDAAAAAAAHAEKRRGRLRLSSLTTADAVGGCYGRAFGRSQLLGGLPMPLFCRPPRDDSCGVNDRRRWGAASRRRCDRGLPDAWAGEGTSRGGRAF
eukprot:359032-Chlamydomonas_euryale.AAC.7